MKYILLLLPLFLTGCSALGLISSVIPDGGTDVNANAQIGAENTQQVVGQQNSSEINAQSVDTEYNTGHPSICHDIANSWMATSITTRDI
jgi:hypothetical protein